LVTLFAAVAAGFLVWLAPHFHRFTTGGYWGVIGLMALAGVLVGVSQLHGRDGNPLASFLVVFVPVLVAAGWVIAAAQPRRDLVRNHVLSWSRDMGVVHAVHNLAEHVTVLAFGLGIVFGVTFELGMVRRGSNNGRVPATLGAAPAGFASTPNRRAAEEPTLVEQPTGRQRAAAATTIKPDTSATPPVSAVEEPTVMGPPVVREQADVAATVELDPPTSPHVPADSTGEQSTAVEPPSLQGPAGPPA
jgi:hypothetical protein